MFDKTFFKLALGLLAIVLVSLAGLYIANHAQNGGSQSVAGAVQEKN